MKRKLKKSIGSFLALAFAMLLITGNKCYAASISAVLATSHKKVTTTFNSGSSGNHWIRVKGYEYYAYKDQYFSYDVTKTKQGGGTLKVTHHAGDSCEFVKSYSGQKLKSYVSLYTEGNVILSAIATY